MPLFGIPYSGTLGQEPLRHFVSKSCETKFLNDRTRFEDLHKRYNFLCSKMMQYIQSVDKNFEIPKFIKEPEITYSVRSFPDRKKKSSNPKTRTSKL